MNHESSRHISSSSVTGRFVLVLALCAPAAAAPPEWKQVYDPLVVRSLHLQIDRTDWDRVRFDQPVEGQTESIERAPARFHGENETSIA